jgi:dihydrofolate synthase/folylpolyglutamate synthase
LRALFAEHAPHVTTYTEALSNHALNRARSLAEHDDLVVATGSLYLAGEALRWAADHGDKQAASEIEGVDH